MKEKLFTAGEIAIITKDAIKNEKRYLGTVMVRSNTTPLSISTISEGKKLIFTEGNEDTGYQHLSDRHSHFRYKSYWVKDENGELKLDKPSKFHTDMAPIIIFPKIADIIYSPENINISKNKRPDLFDMYTATYRFKDQEAEIYHLLTYKETRVVHTMYPNKKKHNLKAIARFGKGHVVATRSLTQHTADLLIPYEDSTGKMVYSILIRKFYLEQKERIMVQEHDAKGNVTSLFIWGERDLLDFESFKHDMMSRFQHTDLVDYERIINQMADGVETIKLDPKTFKW